MDLRKVRVRQSSPSWGVARRVWVTNRGRAGAGMIEPHLAIMLAFVLTDVDLPRWVDGLVNIYREA